MFVRHYGEVLLPCHNHATGEWSDPSKKTVADNSAAATRCVPSTLLEHTKCTRQTGHNSLNSTS